jgi:hypothetical protein
MRRRADEKGVDFLVVDTGDRAEGNGLWDASDPKGMYTRRILQQLDVDILTTGWAPLGSLSWEWSQTDRKAVQKPRVV